MSASAATPESDSSAQGRLFGELLVPLGRLVGERPAVVVVEDLHWADHSTLAFLAFLLGNLRQERLLLVVTVRRDAPDDGAVRRWLVEQRRNPAVRELRLLPLDRIEVPSS